MARETVHIVQPYRVVRKRGLVAVDAALPVRSAAAAKRLFETGNYAGVDAYTITGDEELGEYGGAHVPRPARTGPGLGGSRDV